MGKMRHQYRLQERQRQTGMMHGKKKKKKGVAVGGAHTGEHVKTVKKAMD